MRRSQTDRTRRDRPNTANPAQGSTKHRVAVTGDGLPIARAATAANVLNAVLFERLLLAALAVLARTGTVFAGRAMTTGPPNTLYHRSGPSRASTSSAGPAVQRNNQSRSIDYGLIFSKF